MSVDGELIGVRRALLGSTVLLGSIAILTGCSHGHYQNTATNVQFSAAYGLCKAH